MTMAYVPFEGHEIYLENYGNASRTAKVRIKINRVLGVVEYFPCDAGHKINLIPLINPFFLMMRKNA